MEDYPFEKALRDSRVNMIFEGTNEILRVLVALSGMRDVGADLQEVSRALKAPLSSLGILSDYAARKIRAYASPARLTRLAPALAAEGDLVVKYARSASGAVETERLANVSIDLYACVAVLSRATAAIAERGAEKSAEEVRVAKAFVEGAKYRMVGHLKEMDKNRDAALTAIAETAYGGPGYPFSYWS